VVEDYYFAIYGIPPLHPMADYGEGMEPHVIAVGPQWTYRIERAHYGLYTPCSPVTIEVTGGRNIARCAIMANSFLCIVKISIGHDCVDVDLVSHRIVADDGSEKGAAAIGSRRAVWYEHTADGEDILKTCTFITDKENDTTLLLGKLDAWDAPVKLGSIRFAKEPTDDIRDFSFDESSGRICVLLCCGEYSFYNHAPDNPRINLVILDSV
jgi:hypothetical protein